MPPTMVAPRRGSGYRGSSAAAGCLARMTPGRLLVTLPLLLAAFALGLQLTSRQPSSEATAMILTGQL